jgi:hypothetical protein
MTRFAFGHPRPFNSFAETATEAAMSRLYAGIHFKSAIERGLEQGRRVAEEVNRLRLLFERRPAPGIVDYAVSRAAPHVEHWRINK